MVTPGPLGWAWSALTIVSAEASDHVGAQTHTSVTSNEPTSAPMRWARWVSVSPLCAMSPTMATRQVGPNASRQRPQRHFQRPKVVVAVVRDQHTATGTVGVREATAQGLKPFQSAGDRLKLAPVVQGDQGGGEGVVQRTRCRGKEGMRQRRVLPRSASPALALGSCPRRAPRVFLQHGH